MTNRARAVLLVLSGVVAGAGARHVADIGHPSVADLRVAAMGFGAQVESLRKIAAMRCGRAAWQQEKEVILRRHAEQEAAFNFAVIWLHAYDSPARDDYKRAATVLNDFRTELEAMRCD